MQGASLCDDPVNGGRDTSFFCDVRRNRKNLSGESLRDSFKLFTRFREIDRVDLDGTVDQAAFCYSESDSTIRPSDCEENAVSRRIIRGVTACLGWRVAPAMILPPSVI